MITRAAFIFIFTFYGVRFFRRNFTFQPLSFLILIVEVC